MTDPQGSQLDANGTPILNALHDMGLIKSFAEGRRLINCEAIRINGVLVNGEDAALYPEDKTLRVGKRLYKLQPFTEIPGDPSQKPGGDAKAPLASDDVLEAAAILKLLADGEDVSDQRADARRLARVLFNGWKAGLPAPEPSSVKGPESPPPDLSHRTLDAAFYITPRGESFEPSKEVPPTPPGVEVGRAYDGSPMDIPWIIRSLEQIAKPLGDSDTGIARLMALRNFIQSLKHPPQEGRP